MRRALALGLILLSIGVPARQAQGREESNRHSGREHDWRLKECRFASRDGKPGWNTEEVKSTIRCAERKWAGDLELGIAIAACESGLHATAQNPYSSAGGVWQAIDSTWMLWKNRYADLMEWWNMRPGKLNGRTNAVLGWRVFEGSGTGPWEPSRWCWG